MKHIILFLIPVSLLAQEDNPCFSINDVFMDIKAENPTHSSGFNEGWNMFGSPCYEPQNAFDFFQDSANYIVILKEVNGDLYWPE